MRPWYRRRWDRYHHLPGDLLRHELDRAEPGLAVVLHRRAWAWHRAHGNLAEAIGHAIGAGDLAGARELIVSGWRACLNEGLVETVEAWLDRLPPQTVADDARLCLVRAWLARNLGRLYLAGMRYVASPRNHASPPQSPRVKTRPGDG